MDDFEKELKEGFLEESDSLLEDAEQALLDLESTDDDSEIINRLFRAAHNLKGTSRAVGFGELAEFTHIMENLILKIKEGELSITPNIVTVLLNSFDHISTMTSGLKIDFDATFDSSAHVEVIEQAIRGEASDSVPENDIQEDDTPIDDVISDDSDTFSLDDIDHIEEHQEEYITNSQSDESALNEDELDLSDLMNIEDKEQLNYESAATKIEEPTIKEQPTPPPASLSSEPSTENTTEELQCNDQAVIETPEAFESSTDHSSNEVHEATDLEPLTQPKSESPEPQAATAPATGPEPVKATPTEEVPSKKVSSASKPGTNAISDESIRVKLSRLEKLNNFVGELVIIQSVLVQHREEIKSPLVQKSLGQLSKLSKEIHEISMSLRMLPIKPTLQKMQRIVRDTSGALEKKVNLILEGVDTEVDKTVLEKLNDPLTHIIRNAVDHGLEMPNDRIQCGKSEAGNITVSCFHEGNNLVIKITDDGKGIDPIIIRSKAIEKGVIKENSELSDKEIVNLIFHPGFSTKSEVSEVSGRGVGMDVVKTNIHELSGEVSVSSEVGSGSVFKISLPLTMAVIDGMITQVGNEKYVLPLVQVHETIRPSDGEINFVTGIGKVLSLRGENIPIKSIAKVLNRPGTNTAEIQDHQIAIIVEVNGSKHALLVDDIHHQQQIVVKSLGEEITARDGFVGSSILGDGMPAFILDLHQLISPKTKSKKQNARRSA